MITLADLPETAWWAIALALAAVPALVYSDFHGRRRWRYLFKPLAAAAFVILALALGAIGSSYGQWLLAGLCACVVGDLLLMFERESAFTAGLFAFLCGHLLYAIGFAGVASEPGVPVMAVIAVVTLLALSTAWLWPHVGANMKAPVAAYLLVIGAMLVCAAMTRGTAAAGLIIVGAFGFALSDIAVARQQFVRTSRLNPLWGTPLYFGSQMLLALSLAA